jgi:hypothetical protein
MPTLSLPSIPVIKYILRAERQCDVNKGSQSSERFSGLSIWWRLDTTRSGFWTTRFEPGNRSTMSPHVMTGVARSTSPRKLIVTSKSGNTSKNNNEYNQICRWMIKTHKLGSHKPLNGKTVKYKLYLSKTRTLIVRWLLNIKNLGSIKIPWTKP